MSWNVLGQGFGSVFRAGYTPYEPGGSLEPPIAEGVLFRRQLLAPLSQGPPHPFQSGVCFFGEDPFERFQVGLAQGVNGRAIEFGPVEAIRADLSRGQPLFHGVDEAVIEAGTPLL
jgi:hypothetical protein